MEIRKLKLSSVSLIIKNKAVFRSSQGIQLQLVVGRDLPQLRDVEHGKARTAGNQDGFCGFARNELSRTFLIKFTKKATKKSARKQSFSS